MIRLGRCVGRFAIAACMIACDAAPAFAGAVVPVSVAGSDIAFNAHTGMLYASVPSVAGPPYGNRVVEISPVDGSITRSVFVGSEPAAIGSSPDAAVAYVGIEGAASARRIDLATMTAGAPFGLGRTEEHGPFLYATDIRVMPGSPETIAVALHRIDQIPWDAGVAVFDAGVARPIVVGTDGATPSSLAFGADAGTLYGADGSSPPTLARLTVAADGVTVAQAHSLSSSNPVRIVFDAGRIYTAQGTVFDQNLAMIGTYAASGPVVVDGASSAVYIVERGRVHVFDRDTFAASYSMPISDVDDPAVVATGCGAGCMGIVFESGKVVVVTVDETIFRDGFESLP